MKKIDFFQATKEMPLNRDELAEKIANVPVDIARGYIQFLEKSKNQLERTISLFHSVDGLFYHELLDQFDDDELPSLNRITETLNDADVLNKIDELLTTSMGYDLLSNTDNNEKVKELFELVENLDEDKMKDVASKLIPWGWHIERLTKLLIFYLEKKGDKESVLRHLKNIDAQNLNNMIFDIKTFINISEENLEIIQP